MNLKILEKNLQFTRASAFSKRLKSADGSMFLATTRPNDPKITISVEKLAKAGIREHVIRIPLGNKSYTLAVIPGPTPKKRKQGFVGHSIAIGGSKEEPLYFELDTTKGNWHIESDLNADALNLIFDASTRTK